VTKPPIEELGGELGLHRIAIWRDLPQPVIGALLRHELEHAKQWEAHGMGLFRLHDVIKVALWRKVDSLPFGGLVINFAPIEIDANAAAAQFAWSRDPDAVNELLSRGALGQHEPLFR
jgi:hypothetical protein